MNHIGLFEGIGGFSLAARWMGWETISWCEINPFCQTVLKHHFKNAKAHSDIKTTDFSIYRGQCDILTGGFPCQPYSTAGKRLGTEDERHLWPEMLRAIREISPRWVVGENVRGLTNWNGGLVFDEVQADLEAEGYEVLPFLLPACAVNAPHRRDRIWFIAYASGTGIQIDKTGTLHNGNGNSEGEIWRETKQQSRFGTISEKRIFTDTSNQGLQRRQFDGSFNQEGQERGEQPSGSVTELHKIENWVNFPTQSPVCIGNDGIPTGLDGITFSKWRNESIKAYGNAIVPQVAYEIFKAIELFETT